MAQMFIFGIGYSGGYIAASLRAAGWEVNGTGRGGEVDFDDVQAVTAALGRASHVLSTVPPDTAGDPILARFDEYLSGKWLGYLSSTGVYGDAGGAWVDESAPANRGRRPARNAADARWLALGAYVFRLPGIYGPDRSALQRVRDHRAQRIDVPGQVFSRIYVTDIARAVLAAMTQDRADPGAYNIADDLPVSQNTVIAEACHLLGQDPPPLEAIGAIDLSPAARAFYTENRRITNGKARRLLGWTPEYPTYVSGLAAALAADSASLCGAPP